MRRALSLTLLLVIAPLAHADAPRASAVELFTRGRALAAEGKCSDAVPYFLDTLKLDASVGALLNLAECHEKLREPSQACRRYREAEALARSKSDDREGLARAGWTKLVPLVPKLAIVTPPGAHVTVDGVEPRADTDSVAEGEHVVSATAPGKRTWTATIRAAGTDTITVTVPELESSEGAPRTTTRTAPGYAQRFIGAAAAIVGAVGIGVGGVLGGVALSKKGDAVTLSAGPDEGAFNDARAAAKTFADASTGLFIAGAVVAAVGITLVLTAPHTQITIAPSANGASATLSMRF